MTPWIVCWSSQRWRRQNGEPWYAIAAQRLLDRNMGERGTAEGILRQCLANAKTDTARRRLKAVLVGLERAS